MFNIFITNLGKYNEGFLIGEWLELPTTDEDIEACLERIGINDYCEEYFITDYENDFGYEVPEYVNLEELNDIAEQLEDADPDIVKAANYFYCDIDEAMEHLDDIMYVTTLGTFETEAEAIGYYYANEVGCLDIPEAIENYFDYESYGRDIMIEGSFYTADDGSIYELVA